MQTKVFHVVIVGAGMAGVSVATRLRELGFAGAVTLVSQEEEAPYDRPPLSKQFLLDGDADAIRLQPEALAAQALADIALIRGNPAVALDVRAREVRLGDGRGLRWDRLVLATGARPRVLPALARSPRVQTLRTLEDARAIRQTLTLGARLLIVGGGPIGLELAAMGLRLDARVTLVEAADRLMTRSAPALIAEHLRRHHVDSGVDIRLGRSVADAPDDGHAVLDDGARVAADLIVVGIGVHANDELAVQAGLAADDGIFVDGFGRTTAPGVFAIGDVTRQRNPATGRFERIETWSNAQGQARALAAHLTDPDNAVPYAETPWFWSDQGELRLQAAGAITGDEQAIRGDPQSGRFSLIQWRDGRIVGVAAVNAARDFHMLRRLVAAGSRLRPEVLTDPQANLKSLIAAAAAPSTPA
ncbi:NAD(P)/FAD-dependent oxidoreductase [Cupriavidus necator]|uniref:NAD(P)/FAD-dependent oxidoreductase n=1 Tax=Cupriavidus necator TaxID=106590 RepID=UPI0005B35F1E|nr:FAD-dependent oxidoreductase [Cupriavidus necator]